MLADYMEDSVRSEVVHQSHGGDRAEGQRLQGLSGRGMLDHI